MTLTEILKAQGLTGEQITTVTAEMATNKIYTTNEENIDIRYNKLKTQLEDAESKLETADTTIADLKVANKDNEALQGTIKAHEETIKTMKSDYTTKLQGLSMDTAIQGKLANARYPELLATKFDKSKLTVTEDGTVLGVDEQYEVIKGEYKDLFKPIVAGNTPNNTGGTPAPKNPWSKEHFNLTEQARVMKEDPALAQQLKTSR